jgi:cysteinyl-tRNA synthetase
MPPIDKNIDFGNIEGAGMIQRKEPRNNMQIPGIYLSVGLILLLGTEGSIADQNTDSEIRNIRLRDVKTFAYLIQNVDTDANMRELRQSHYDLYILEPCVTEKGNSDFMISSLIDDIRNYNRSYYFKDPIILAYVDIGQAEDWRWYWKNKWRPGRPEWIVTVDPDDWEGCYPVAYWYPEWEDIVIYGSNGMSHLQVALQNGFDGIYMDWVEGFSDEYVIEKAEDDGINDTAAAMFDFIEKIRQFARIESPFADAEFLVVAQNASDLYRENPARYESRIDAISLEGIWYEGTGGFDDWNDPTGYNIPTNSIYPGWTEEVLGYLNAMKGRLPIFCVEYAQDMGEKSLAAEVYTDLAPAHGFIAYCTRRSLAQLSKTPIPPGYDEIVPTKSSKKGSVRR